MSSRRLAMFAVLVMFVVLAAASPGRAERLTLKTYTTANGLAHNTVPRVVRDSRGFLWFCTNEGISRFDGGTFVNYGVDEGLPSGIVTDLLETRDGGYWVGTSLGLVRFDPRGTPAGAAALFATYRQTRADGAPAPQYVHTLLQGGDGTLWVGAREGLYRDASTDGSRIDLVPVALDHQPRARAIEVRQLMEDRRGALWVGTMEGLFRRSAGGHIDMPLPDAVPSTQIVHALFEDRDGDIWIATRTAGLLQVTVDPVSGRAAVVQVYALARGAPTSWFNSIVQSADGVLWAGTNRGLLQLVRARGERVYRSRAYSTAQGIVGHEVLSVVEDRHRTLWLGMAHAGAAKLPHRGLTTFDAADGLAWAGSLVETPRGELVAIGGPESGRGFLSRFDGETFRAVVPRTRGTNPGWGWNQTLLQDRAGDWWVGTDDGLFRFSGARRVDDLARLAPSAVYTRRDGLIGRVVLRLFEDSRGDIWIGLVGGPGGFGLSRWQRRTGTLRHYTPDDGLPLQDFYVSAFAEDRAGRVWIGFSGLGGLARQEGDGFTRYTSRDGLPAGRVMNLLLDARGHLWAATDRAGVCRFDPATATARSGPPAFVPYTTARGLSSNTASAIVEDRAGRIYIGTGRGIDRLDPATGRITRFSSADGVPTGANAALRDRQGALWFSSPGGLARLVPAEDAAPPAPPILITAVRVGTQPQPISAVGERTIRLLDLPAGNTPLQIDFVALGFGPGDGLRYQFTLEGAEKTWGVLSDQRAVRYANLAPGAYRFLVRAVNGAGVASATPASVAFTVLPPVWRRWWFLLLAGSVLAAAAYGLHRARVTRLLELANMRAGIATDLHDDVGANLTRIAILSEVARRQPGRGDRRVDQALASIARIARESVSGMSDIVWAISPDRDNLGELVRKMREHVEEVFAARDLAVTFTPPSAAPSVKLLMKMEGVMRRDLLLIFKEAVNNAARHSGCSRIAIDFQVEPGRMVLTVADDGAGFDPAGVHDGQGVVSMRRRAQRLGATLAIDSAPGRGTTLTLALVS